MATDSQSAETIRDSSRSGPLVAVTRWSENLSETGYAYLLLTPALILLLLIAIWPLLATFEMSLHADAYFGQAAVGDWVGLQNYVGLFTGELDSKFPAPFLPSIEAWTPLPQADWLNSSLIVTLAFTFVSVFFETLIGFGQALVLNQDFRGRRWVRVAIIIPWAVPIVIQGMIVFLLFQPNIGFLIGTSENPTLLQSLFGFSATPLRNTVDSLIIVMVGDIWKTSAFMALIILAGLQSVDRSLYDVAKVSGASRWQQFKMITLPLVWPTVIVAMLFRTIQAARIYGLIDAVAGCSTVPSLSCMVVNTFSSRLYGTSATVAFVTAGLIALGVSIYIVRFADSDNAVM